MTIIYSSVILGFPSSLIIYLRHPVEEWVQLPGSNVRLVDPGADLLVEETVAGEGVLEDVDLPRPGKSAGVGLRQVVQDGDDALADGLAAVGVLGPNSIGNFSFQSN